MESTFRFRACAHHRHLCHHHHCCRHHHHHHYNWHNLCPRISPHLNFDRETPASVSLVEEEPKQNEFDNEDEQEDDPIFVLTDEWRDYFAKSEAKRKLEKQLAKKKDRRA
ncbi:hypothetical protein M5689_019050 [Euphorbia peplus]|nr:hypothetical protein M5689_019050 [Euphorbia peplus]